MIEWPARENLDEASKRNLDLFGPSLEALDLAKDADTWKLVAWARSEEPPVRITLRNEQTLEDLTISVEESGTWMVNRKPVQKT